MKKIINRELVVIIAVTGLAILSMSLLGPMMPLYLTSIGIDPAILGLILSAAMMGMVLGESGGGWLADKVGIRVPMLIGTFLCAPLVLSIIFIRNLPLIFVVFFFWGIVRSAVFAPGRGYIGTNISPSYKATFMALYATIMAVSRSLGTFASGIVKDARGYDWIFFIASGIALLGGVLIVTELTKRELRKPSPAATPNPASVQISSFPLYRQRPFVIQCIIAALYFTTIGVLSFLSLFAAQVAGLAATQVGILFTISAIVNAVLLIPMGRLADYKNKKTLMAVGLLITAAGMVGISLSNNFAQLAVSQVIGSLGGSMFGPAAVALLENTPHRQNTSMGVYGGCEDLGMIIGSALGGLIWSLLGPASTFLFVGAIPAVAGALISLTLIKKLVAPPSERAPVADIRP
jgi:MFS family permease